MMKIAAFVVVVSASLVAVGCSSAAVDESATTEQAQRAVNEDPGGGGSGGGGYSEARAATSIECGGNCSGASCTVVENFCQTESGGCPPDEPGCSIIGFAAAAAVRCDQGFKWCIPQSTCYGYMWPYGSNSSFNNTCPNNYAQ